MFSYSSSFLLFVCLSVFVCLSISVFPFLSHSSVCVFVCVFCLFVCFLLHSSSSLSFFSSLYFLLLFFFFKVNFPFLPPLPSTFLLPQLYFVVIIYCFPMITQHVVTITQSLSRWVCFFMADLHCGTTIGHWTVRPLLYGRDHDEEPSAVQRLPEWPLLQCQGGLPLLSTS